MTREFGWITPKTLKENAPEGANLWIDLGDDDLVHDVVYYKLDDNKRLFWFSEYTKGWEACLNLELISKLRHMDDDGNGSCTFRFGEKVVFVDKETHPQIWTVLYYLANGNFKIMSDGPSLQGLMMPASNKEIRKATQDEIDANQRL